MLNRQKFKTVFYPKPFSMSEFRDPIFYSKIWTDIYRIFTCKVILARFYLSFNFFRDTRDNTTSNVADRLFLFLWQNQFNFRIFLLFDEISSILEFFFRESLQIQATCDWQNCTIPGFYILSKVLQNFKSSLNVSVKFLWLFGRNPEFSHNCIMNLPICQVVTIVLFEVS